MRHQICYVFEIITVCLLGLMSGFFFAFAIDVVPAMRTLDATTYVNLQQAINREVRSAVFSTTYFGAAALPFVSALMSLWCGRTRRALAWLLIGALFGTAVFWVTRSINVPINEALSSWQAGAQPADWQEMRDQWNQANLWRTIAALVCFAGGAYLLATTRRRTEGSWPRWRETRQ